MRVPRSPHRSTRDKIAILREIDLEAADRNASWREAAKLLAGRANVSLATIYRWRKSQVKGRGCIRKTRSDARSTKSEVSPEALDYLASDFARPEAPSFSSCYRRLTTIATTEEWTIASASTMRRRLRAIAPLARIRRNSHDLLIPSQKRTVSHLAPMDAVNADAQRLDVRCQWSDGRISRPYLTAWQDVYSRALLGFSITRTECEDGYRVSFLRMLEDHGCPGKVYFDNGRAICAISLTGGAENRYRRIVSEHKGIITRIVGAKNVRFVKPAHGQSKPVERAFRDLADSLAKHPLLSGCYTGSNPTNKPANYGSNSCDLETLTRVVKYAVHEYNTRAGRQTESARIHQGMSAIQILNTNKNKRPYPHRDLVEELRYASKRVTALTRDGTVKLFGNAYWHPKCSVFIGQSKQQRQVNVLYNPDDLSGCRITVGGKLVTLTRTETGQFDNREDAKRAARRKRRALKALKRAADESINLSNAELQAMWNRHLTGGDRKTSEDSSRPSPSVIVPNIEQAA